MRRWHAGVTRNRDDSFGEVLLHQRRRGEVAGDVDNAACRGRSQSTGGGTGLGEGIEIQRHDEVRTDQVVDEAARADEVTVRQPTADQRLDGDDAIGLDVDDRLQSHDQPVLVEGKPDHLAVRVAHVHGSLELVVEEFDSISSEVLCGIERDVRMLEERVDVERAGILHDEPQRGGEMERRSVDGEGTAERLAKPFGDRQRLIGVIQPLQERNELVAALACQ